MSKPHKHAEIIKAWADGAQLERRLPSEKYWYTCHNPTWHEDEEYRVKYPTLDADDVQRIANKHAISVVATMLIIGDVLHAVIDKNRVVPIAEVREVARNMHKAERAARDMAIAEAVKSFCEKIIHDPFYQDQCKGDLGSIDLPAIIATVKE